MEQLQLEILQDLTTELQNDTNFKSDILSSKIKNAIREVRKIRNYQEYHTEEFITSDLKWFYSSIRELALYDYNQVGVEGQTSHSENGTIRAWKSRSECLNGITSFCMLF